MVLAILRALPRASVSARALGKKLVFKHSTKLLWITENLNYFLIYQIRTPWRL